MKMCVLKQQHLQQFCGALAYLYLVTRYRHLFTKTRKKLDEIIVFEYVDKSPDWHGRIAMQNVKTGWASALLVF